MEPVSISTRPCDPATDAIHPGLEGIVFATSRITAIDGERGELRYAGYPLEDLAGRLSPEAVALLLARGELPSAEEEAALCRDLDARRDLPAVTLGLLRELGAAGVEPMAALRVAVDSLALAAEPAAEVDGFDPVALGVMARLPTLIGAFHRLRRGQEPVAPRPELGQAASLLHALAGEVPAPEQVRALSTYLVTVADHGANASTFALRVVLSTAAGWREAFGAALGALSGPLHGGAPGPALELVREIATPERAEAILAAKLAAGERLMGFGHRVYKTRDPRAEVLARAAEALLAAQGDAGLVALVRHVEKTAEAVLERHKPGRRLKANVELYTALVLDSLGLPEDLFTPVFALGRVAGWIAHGREQRAEGRLIRPRLRYAGPAARRLAA